MGEEVEEEDEKVFDRIISVAGYPSPNASIEVQQQDGYESADAYGDRLLLLGSSEDHVCSTVEYSAWWEALEEHGARTFKSITFTHDDYDYFLEGMLFPHLQIEARKAAAFLVLHHPSHPRPPLRHPPHPRPHPRPHPPLLLDGGRPRGLPSTSSSTSSSSNSPSSFSSSSSSLRGGLPHFQVPRPQRP